jgi:hypothetical protein
MGDGRRGRQHTSRPRALGPSRCAEFRGSPRTRQLILQLGVSHLRRGRIARGGAKAAPLSDHLQLAAHRTARTLRHTGCPAYGYSAIRARRIPSLYRARAPGQKEASLLRMVDSERHNVNNPLRAVCELAIRRLNGARRINHARELSRPAVQM